MPKVRFQCDEHVSNALAAALRRRGIDIQTTADAGWLGISDEQLLANCHAAGRVLVTHDADFLRLHNQGHAHNGITYSRQGGLSMRQLVAGLVLLHDVLEAEEMVDRVEFL